MAQIELKFESFEELVDFSKKILGVAEEQAHPVYKESKVTYGTQSATPAQQTPAAAPPVQPVAAPGTGPTSTDCSTRTGCTGSAGCTYCRAYLYPG